MEKLNQGLDASTVTSVGLLQTEMLLAEEPMAHKIGTL